MTSSTVKHPIKIGEVTYWMSPIGDIGREQLDEYVRQKYVESASKVFNAIEDPQVQAAAIDRVMSKASALQWASAEGARLLATPEGQAMTFYVSILPNHPTASFEEIREHFFNPETIALANGVWRELNINRPKRMLAAEEGKKRQGKRRRSRRKKSIKS